MKEKFSAIALIIMVLMLVSGPAMPAVAAGPGAEDCRDYGVDYKNSEGLTKKEITERMDNALFKSLNKYDDCLQQSQSQSGGSAGGSSGGGGGGGSGSASSTAASGIQGTEMENKSASKKADTATANANSNNAAKNQANAGKLPENPAMANGKLPEDIPSADNDTILQQKVREAAMNEPDPEKKAKLWNEYRKLKNMSLKDQSNI